MFQTEKIKLVMYDFKQCDPKRCSGQKLAKLGIIHTINKSQPFQGVLLSSEGKTYLSKADLQQSLKSGLGVIDCSWNEILKYDSVPIKQLKCRTHKLLPFLIAANQVNYGKPLHLNCAEAIVAGLWILGYKEDAIDICLKLSYGKGFIQLNEEYLDWYAKCGTTEEIEVCQKKIIDNLGKRESSEENSENSLSSEEKIDYDAIRDKIEKEKEVEEESEQQEKQQ